MRPMERLAVSADALTCIDLVQDEGHHDHERMFFVDKHTPMTSSKAAASAALNELDVILTVQQHIAKQQNNIKSHVVALRSYRLDPQDHRLHLVMEHCARGDLFRVAQQESQRLQAGLLMPQQGLTTSERGLQRVFHQVLRGVQSLHECRIAHMDLSLENAFVTADNDVRLGDFAHSQRFQCDNDGRVQPLAMASVDVAKRAYAAPELLLDHAATIGDVTKVDAWAVGVMLWHLLTRSPLFPSTGGATIDDPVFRAMVAHRQGRGGSPSWIDQQLPTASPMLHDLLLRLLDPYPSTRLSAAGALQHPWFRSTWIRTKRTAVSRLAALTATTTTPAEKMQQEIQVPQAKEQQQQQPSEDHKMRSSTSSYQPRRNPRSRTASAEISLDATRVSIRPSGFLRRQPRAW